MIEKICKNPNCKKTFFAHHIKPYANFPKLRVSIKNGITLCDLCHKKEHIKMRETQFKRRAVKIIKKELPGCWVHHATDRWVSGIPDLFILYQGVFTAVELKVGKNKASKLQEITLARISAAGGMTWICYGDSGKNEILDVCRAIKERAAAEQAAGAKGE